MVFLASQLIGLNIYTLRAGGKIGEVIGVIIDPNKFTIAGFWVELMRETKDMVLLMDDIREISIKGAIINDLTDVVEPDDLPKLKKLLDINYQIPGKKITSGRKTLGKANDFGVNLQTYSITQITGKPTITRSFSTTKLTFLRRQIVKIDDSKIEVSQGPLADQIKKESKAMRLVKGTHYSASASDTSE